MSEPSEKQINVPYEKVGKIIQDQIKLLSNATNLEDIKRKTFYESLKSKWDGSIGRRGPWQKDTGSNDAESKKIRLEAVVKEMDLSSNESFLSDKTNSRAMQALAAILGIFGLIGLGIGAAISKGVSGRANFWQKEPAQDIKYHAGKAGFETPKKGG